MTSEQIEMRFQQLEGVVADLLARLTAESPSRPRGLAAMTPLPPDLHEAHKKMEAYGRYFRKTGTQPPPDWTPGDPIPEPDEGWCPR